MPIALFGTLDETLSNSLFENYFFIPRLSPDLLHRENNVLIYLAKRDKMSVSHTSFHGESHKIILTAARNPRLRDEESGLRIPVRFFYSPEPPDRLWGPPSFLFNGYPGAFPGLNRPVFEGNHSSPFSVEVKIQGSSISSPHICLHCADKEKCTRKL
jgi:hypothetical protein